MPDDQQLLQHYVAEGSEAAFGELVARYVNLVYSVALRRTGGDTHLAQDVAQLVFTDLARKARSLPEGVVLAGWLHRATRYAAAQLLRTERRRVEREQEAVAMNTLETSLDWEQIRPLLDEALDELGHNDRDALLLRFFEQRSLAEVGRALGSNEDAARKRVSRALEKLRARLTRRGVTTSAVAFSTALPIHAIQVAPAGLAATLTSASLAGAAAGTGTTLTLLKLMATTKLKVGIVSAIVVAGVVTSLLIQHQAQAKLDEQGSHLRQQAEQLAQLAADNERLSILATNGNNSAEKARIKELEKLRAESALLRGQTNDLAALQEAEQQSRQPSVIDAKTPMQFKELDWAKSQCIEAWARAFVAYAHKNQGQLPTSFEQAKSFWRKDIERDSGGRGSGMTADEFEKLYGAMTEQFEIMYHGSLDGITNPEGAIVLREKKPWPHATGKWGKCFALISPDQGGEPHLQYCSSTDKTANGNWDWFEKAHTPAPPSK